MLNLNIIGARILVLLTVAAPMSAIAGGRVIPKNETEKRARIAVAMDVGEILERSGDIERKKRIRWRLDSK
jgi:hypothetical protein